MAGLRRTALLIGLITLVLTNLHHQALAVMTIEGTAQLGAVTTTQMLVSNNTPQPATVQIYEALSTSDAPAAQTTPLRVPLPDSSTKLDPALEATLSRGGSSTAELLVYLPEQADLRHATEVADWAGRGQAVYETLTSHAATAQEPLLAWLRSEGYQPRSFWIVNALQVRGDLRLAQALAERQDVALVTANTAHKLSQAETTAASPSDTAWGLAKINAPATWADWGVRGQGIVVANIDTGVTYSHTALLQNYRGWSPAGLNHNYNWFAPASPVTTMPTDLAGHGTHTMGTMVGRVAADIPSVGVAPGARWIAVRGCSLLFCEDADLIAAAQWLLAPTDLAGEHARPDLRPHIINNSWVGPEDDLWYTGYVEAWNAAGMLSVFAGGNTGSEGCQSAVTPGNYSVSFAVGATDESDFAATFSSRGPSPDGRIKPDMSAPGVRVLSAWRDGAFRLSNGTSMAAPHVAGVAALLWSSNPNLIGDLAATKQVLTSSSQPLFSSQCGDGPGARPNNVYGWGRLDAWRAVQAARVDIPWLTVPSSVEIPASGTALIPVTFDARQVPGPGRYRARLILQRPSGQETYPVVFNVTAANDIARGVGQVIDRWSGQGVYARIAIGGGPLVQTNLTGQYSVTLPYGTYPLTVTASGYLPITDSLQIPDSQTRIFTLTPNIPHLELSAPPLSTTLKPGAQQLIPITLSNAGPQPLTVQAAVPPMHWSVGDSAAGGVSVPLFDMSAFPALPLADDQIYTDVLDLGFSIPGSTGSISRIYLSSNGWVSATPQRVSSPGASCLPSTTLPVDSFAAFWTDLDPSRGGAVRAGQVDNNTFVVSYEAVPLWTNPGAPQGPAYTFQIIFKAAGTVHYRYGAMGGMPQNWSVGAVAARPDSQRIACHFEPQTLSGRTWSLLLQTPSPIWLGVDPATPIAIAPGASAVLNARFTGAGYLSWRTEPFTGQIKLSTDDPRQPVVALSASLKVREPVHQLRLPQIRR